MIFGDFIVIDIETSGGSMNNIPEGFQLLVTGTRSADVYGVYTAEPASLDQLRAMLSGFPGPVVTFNGTRFDLPILDRWMHQLLGKPLEVHAHYDLLREITLVAGRRISLDKLSLYTFGQQKMDWDHRWNARVWVEAPQRLVDYNRVDLDLTHELFMRVLRREPLFLGDTTVHLPLPG